MLNLRFLPAGLNLISLVTFILCLFCGWLFYAFYFKWIRLFEDGRYFDSETEVVFHDSGVIWGIFSLAFLLLSIALRFLARKIRRKAINEIAISPP